MTKRIITVAEVREDGGWQRIDLPDRLNRKDLKRILTGVPGADIVAQWGVRIREVPGDYWSLDDQTAVIACPCGETPAALALSALTECACGRFFFFDGSNVWALGAPADAAAQEEPPVVN
jgi:hypothetical protein